MGALNGRRYCWRGMGVGTAFRLLTHELRVVRDTGCRLAGIFVWRGKRMDIEIILAGRIGVLAGHCTAVVDPAWGDTTPSDTRPHRTYRLAANLVGSGDVARHQCGARAFFDGFSLGRG